MGTPVVRKAVKIPSTLPVNPPASAACFIKAQVPATCGVAMEVPEKTSKPPPGTEELMSPPGAISDKKEARFEKNEMPSSLSVDPTLTAVEIQPGELI